MGRPWFTQSGLEQLADPRRVQMPLSSARRSTSWTMQSLDFTGGLSLHALRRTEGTVPRFVLWIL